MLRTTCTPSSWSLPASVLEDSDGVLENRMLLDDLREECRDAEERADINDALRLVPVRLC